MCFSLLFPWSDRQFCSHSWKILSEPLHNTCARLQLVQYILYWFKRLWMGAVPDPFQKRENFHKVNGHCWPSRNDFYQQKSCNATTVTDVGFWTRRWYILSVLFFLASSEILIRLVHNTHFHCVMVHSRCLWVQRWWPPPSTMLTSVVFVASERLILCSDTPDEWLSK